VSIYHLRVDVGTMLAYTPLTPQLDLSFDGKLVTAVNLASSGGVGSNEIGISFDGTHDDGVLTPGTPLSAVEFERQTVQKVWLRRYSGASAAGLYIDVTVEG